MNLTIRKILSDLYFTLCGKDNRLSLRRILSVASFILMWKSALSGLPYEIVFIAASFSAVMLGITTWQNIKLSQNTPHE